MRTSFTLAVVCPILLILDACQCMLAGRQPSAAAATAAAAGDCTLELMDARRTLSQRMYATGSPALVVLEKPADTAGDGEIRSGDRITMRPASADDAGTQGITARQVYIAEGEDSSGHVLAAGSPLSDGAFVRLRTGPAEAYVRESHGAIEPGPRDQATRLELLKADMPDRTQPSSCDSHIRSHDLVLLLAIRPGTWMAADGVGSLSMPRAPCREDATMPASRLHCGSTNGGSLVCAWTPQCSLFDTTRSP